MKKTVVRSVIAALVLLATVLSLAACDDPETTEAETETQTETQKPTSKPSSTAKPSTDDLKGDKVLWKYIEKYKTVVDKSGSGSVVNAANSVAIITYRLWDTSGGEVDDGYAPADENPYEILVGKTDRPESAEFIATLKEGEGGYTVKGRRIIIGGYDDVATVAAADLFCRDVMTLYNSGQREYITAEDGYVRDLSGRISIMSYNVYVGIGNDDTRAQRVISSIKVCNPDIFGVQEASPAWKTRLVAAFGKEYEIFGEPREKNGESMLVFVRKSKFSVTAFGTKWLTDTPDEKSKVDGSLCYRIATYVTVKTEDGRKFNFVNTHLDHSKESVRAKQTEYLLNIIESELDRSLPTVVVGDFNSEPGKSTYNKMSAAGFLPSYALTENESDGKEKTFESGARIDYCYISDHDAVEVQLYDVYTDDIFGKASDHYPVLTVINY